MDVITYPLLGLKLNHVSKKALVIAKPSEIHLTLEDLSQILHYAISSLTPPSPFLAHTGGLPSSKCRRIPTPPHPIPTNWHWESTSKVDSESSASLLVLGWHLKFKFKFKCFILSTLFHYGGKAMLILPEVLRTCPRNDYHFLQFYIFWWDSIV